MDDAATEGGGEIHVAAALVFGPAGVLIAQRPAGTHLAGLWEFPGGKIETGESPFEAVRRELREELGIEVEPVELWLVTRHAYPERSVVLHFIRCHHRAGTPRPLGCAAVRWARPDELETLPFPDADRAILSRLLGPPGTGAAAWRHPPCRRSSAKVS